jgi:fatty-acyl-CoA synthase
MSETCPFITRAALRSPEQREDEEAMLAALTTAGINVPLVEMRIVDEDMNDQPRDGRSRGELVLRAPWLTQCYVADSKASANLWRGGWLHTQDVATIDSQGHLQIRDRLKDVIKTGGEWIDSILLEEIVATADGVADVSIIAVPDSKWGERPLAIVVANPGAALGLEAINVPVDRAIASGKLTRHAKLDKFEIVDQLPRTSVGKIDKKALRARFA